MTKKQLIVDIPKTALLYKNGYVYINVESSYDPAVKYTKNKRRCIGRKINNRQMVANDIYVSLFDKDHLPEPSGRSDTLATGALLYFMWAAQSSGLDASLSSVFDEDSARLIKDLAVYAIVMETDVFQHYPSFGFKHAIFSGSIVSDSTISRFLRNEITPSVVQQFLDEWANRNSGKGRAFLCYDSTNVNCVAEGVELAQMGHAKDDPSKPQVNLEYVVRQEDGLPLIYKTYPGSIVDITEGSDMIEMIHSLGYRDVTVICDRGYISKDNVTAFDESGVKFLLMLRSCNRSESLIDKYGKRIRLRSERYIPEHDLYGMTVRHRLFEAGPCRYFHILWDQNDADKTRRSIMKKVSVIEMALSKMKDKGKRLEEKQEKEYAKYFDIDTALRSRKIKEFRKNTKLIDEAVAAAGFHILVSSEEMTCSEAIDAYIKRDCVEKSFRALKSNMGMDALRGHSDESDEGRIFILFVSSILRAIMFHSTKNLRWKERKNYTTPAIIKELDKIEVVIDHKTQKYTRRYKLTAKQKKILSTVKLTEKDVDSLAESIPSSYNL